MYPIFTVLSSLQYVNLHTDVFCLLYTYPIFAVYDDIHHYRHLRIQEIVGPFPSLPQPRLKWLQGSEGKKNISKNYEYFKAYSKIYFHLPLQLLSLRIYYYNIVYIMAIVLELRDKNQGFKDEYTEHFPNMKELLNCNK